MCFSLFSMCCSISKTLLKCLCCCCGTTNKRDLFHLAVAAAHLISAVIIASFVLSGRDDFIEKGKLPLICLEFSANVTESQRMVQDVVVKEACYHFDLLASCFLLHAFTFMAHLLYAYYGTDMSSRWRWFEYYFSGGLVITHFALTTGIRDSTTLLLIGILSATFMPYGYMYQEAEQGSSGVRPLKDEIDAVFARILVFQLPGWVALITIYSIILTNINKFSGIPDFVIGIVVTQTFLLSAFGVVNLFSRAIEKETLDITYTCLSVSSKIIPTFIAITGLRQ